MPTTASPSGVLGASSTTAPTAASTTSSSTMPGVSSSSSSSSTMAHRTAAQQDKDVVFSRIHKAWGTAVGAGAAYMYYTTQAAPVLAGGALLAPMFFYSGHLIGQNRLEQGYKLGTLSSLAFTGASAYSLNQMYRPTTAGLTAIGLGLSLLNGYQWAQVGNKGAARK